MINLTYTKKENPYIWFGITILASLVFYAGIYYVNYYLWILLPIIILGITKAIKILNNPKVPVLKLDSNGLTVLKKNEENVLYPYHEITEVHIYSKLLNGYIKTKDNSKKIHLDTVAIDIEDQKEITEIITSKITYIL